MEEKSAFESFELGINSNIKGYLKETSKWAYFLSIVGFICIFLIIIVGLVITFSKANIFGGTAYQRGYTLGVGISYIILALVYLFPMLYLFKFSSKMKTALKLDNNENFESAFLNLKSVFKYMGIFTIVIISLYILAIIFGAFRAAGAF